MTAANQLLRFERGELEAIMGHQQRSTQKQNFYFSAVDDYPAHQLAQLFPDRSEEHTSELQSLTNLVCRLLLEKKKNENKNKSQVEIGNIR